MNERIAVLCGGDGAEREVSLRSGAAVTAALVEAGYRAKAVDLRSLAKARRSLSGLFDAAFVAMHGSWGEDGRLEAQLEAMGLPYTGSDPNVCDLAMDKGRSCAALRAAGADVVRAGEGERVDLAALLRLLASRDITSVFVEGGGTLNFSLLAAGLVDKVHAFIAPKLVGGARALTSVEGEGFAELADAVELKELTAEMVGADVLLTGYVAKGAK